MNNVMKEPERQILRGLVMALVAAEQGSDYIEDFIDSTPVQDAFRGLVDTLKEHWNEAISSAHNKPGEIEVKANSVRPAISLILPNASVGKPYAGMPDFAADSDRRQLKIRSIELPTELGLLFNPETGEVMGEPKLAGDYVVRAHLEIREPDRPAASAGGRVRLIINPDPRSLWKNLPADSKAPYHKPDEVRRCIELASGRRLLAASKRGRSHANQGLHRDDDVALHHCQKSGWSILAVADGAGSCRFSRRGSQIAVQTSVEHLGELLDTSPGIELETAVRNAQESHAREAISVLTNALSDTVAKAALEATRAIKREADGAHEQVKAYATTLILAAHKQTDSGHIFASYWIGDGGIAVYCKRHEVFLMGEVDSGEYAGQTRFLDLSGFTEPSEYVQRLRVKVVADFTALVLMTDGITDAKFETEHNLKQLDCWDGLWAELEEGLHNREQGENANNWLMDWLDFWSPGNHDDRTIAVLY